MCQADRFNWLLENGKERQLLKTQGEYDFVDDEGNITPTAEDTLMFLGYCLKAYEVTNGEPLAIDNELVKELIMTSVDEDLIPAIIVGTKGEAVILQGDLRPVDGN